MASVSARVPSMQASESCRTVLIGDSAVGKSSITIRFIQDNFYENQVPTIGAAFLTRTVRTEDDKVIKLEIWDTAGQERFHSLVPMYYRKAKAAIVVFDITNQSTFSGAKRWVQDLQKMADPHMVIALVGNKLDLDDERSVDSEEAESYAADNGLLYMETSAKTNRNIDALFFSLVSKVSTSKNDGSTNRNVNLHNTDVESSGCWGRDKCTVL